MIILRPHFASVYFCTFRRVFQNKELPRNHRLRPVDLPRHGHVLCRVYNTRPVQLRRRNDGRLIKPHILLSSFSVRLSGTVMRFGTFYSNCRSARGRGEVSLSPPQTGDGSPSLGSPSSPLSTLHSSLFTLSLFLPVSVQPVPAQNVRHRFRVASVNRDAVHDNRRALVHA